MALVNPSLNQLIAQISGTLVFAQVLIRREGVGFELRHCEDGNIPALELQATTLEGARALAQHAATGEFRPLKSSPTLRRGWRILVPSAAQLERALSQLYPGAVADWYAALSERPPVTHYRDYVNRQTGMYRITALLTDEQVTAVIKSCCAVNSCLKRRLWTVADFPTDSRSDKSLIPCLEPCAVLMEAARQAFRAEQQANES